MHVVRSPDQAITLAGQHSAGKAFVIGGGQIYKLFIAYATSMELTEVHDTPLADTFFPNFSSNEFVEVARIENHDHQPRFDYVTYQRV